MPVPASTVPVGTAAFADVDVREVWTTTTTITATTSTTAAITPPITVRRRFCSAARAAASAARFSSMRRRAAVRVLSAGTGGAFLEVCGAAERKVGARPAGQGERDHEQADVAEDLG